MQTLQRRWPTHVAAIAAYAVLALILTWPLAAHLGTHVPGNGADDPPLTWNLWWVGHSLLTLKANPFDCDYLFYPLGINLAFYTLTLLNGLLSVPLQAALGLVPAANLVLLSSFVLSGYGAFLLIAQVLRRRGRQEVRAGARPAGLPGAYVAAFIGGLIYAFAANKLFYAALGQWNIASSQWIPFYALCLARIEAQPGRRKPILLAALFLLFQAYAEMTFATFLVLLTALWAAWPRPAPQWRRLLVPAAAIGLMFVVGLAPVLAMMLPELSTEGDLLLQGGGFADVFSADLLGFLVPTMHHPLWGSLVERLQFDHTVGQHVYVGVGLLVLAAVGATWGWRRGGTGGQPGPAGSTRGGSYGARFWTVAAILSWLLTLGPELRINGQNTGLPLPFALVSELPFFEGNRYPSRYSVLLLLALAVLAAYGVAAIARWAERVGRRPLRLAPLALAALLMVEHLSAPLPLSDMRVPAIYETIAQLPGDGALLDLPVAWRNGARVTGPLDPIIMFEQYYQSVHGKRLLAGNTSRNPPLKFQYFSEAPVLSTLVALETGHAVDPAVIEADRALAPAVLRFFSIEAVAVQTDHSGPEVVRYVEDALPVRALPAPGETTVLAYATELPAWPTLWQVRADDPLGRLGYGEGWGALGGDIAWAQRRAVRLLVPSDGGAKQMRFQALAPGDGQQMRVTVNDTVVAELALRPGWQDYSLELPAELHAGLNDVWLEFEHLYAADVAGGSGRGIGRTGVESPVNLVVESAGQEVGDFGHIYVNGRDVSPGKRGYNVVVIEPQTGVVEQAAAFDTHLDEGASRALADWIGGIRAGRIVAVAAADEASRLLGTEAVDALMSLGAGADLRGKFRWGHAFIGVKGAAPGTALEALDWMRPVRVVAGEGLTEPQAAAALGSITFEPRAAAGPRQSVASSDLTELVLPSIIGAPGVRSREHD